MIQKATSAGRQGFTLIEIIVVFAVFAVIVIVLTNFLVSMIRNNNQTTIQNEVRQNASKILEDISSEIRNSGCILVSDDGLTVDLYPDADCASPEVVQYSLDSLGVLKKTVGANTVTMTSNKVAVCERSTCADTTCDPGLLIGYTDDLPEKINHAVNISLTVQQADTGTVRSDFCAKTKLESTVSPRNAGN